MLIVRYAPVVVLGACAALSLLALGQGAFGYSFGVTLSEALARWEFAVSYIIELLQFPALIEWCRETLSSLFNVDIKLHESWKHVFLITSLYLTRDIGNNFWFRRDNALILLPFAVICALVSALGFGWLMVSLPMIAVAPPVLSLAAFEYVEAVVTSHSKYRQQNQTPAETLKYYRKHTVRPRFWLAAIVIIMGLAAASLQPAQYAESALLLLPIVYVFMLAMVLLIRGWDVQREGGLLERLDKSNSGRLGLLIARVFAGAAGLLAIDFFGLKPFGL